MEIGGKSDEEVVAEWERNVCVCLERQDFHRLKNVNEELELACEEEMGERGRGRGRGRVIRYSVQMMTHLVLGEVENARVLWMRIPQEIKQSEVQLEVIFFLLSLSLFSTSFVFSFATQDVSFERFLLNSPFLSFHLNSLSSFPKDNLENRSIALEG